MQSKTDEIYMRLKEELLRLRFRRDEIINEKKLAEQYDVSKTPVREALGMLVQEGYLKKIPRVGYLICEVTNEEYLQLAYLRFTLEKGVVLRILHYCSDEQIDSLRSYCQQSAVEYCDFAGINSDFHIAMAALTGNRFLEAAVRDVFQHMRRTPSVKLYTEVRENPHLYHLQLIDAMRARDEEQTLKLIEHECRRDDDPDSIF